MLSALIGVRPSAGRAVRVRPLVPATWDRFAADHVLVRGRVLSVVWDRDGTAYGRGAGLQVMRAQRARHLNANAARERESCACSWSERTKHHSGACDQRSERARVRARGVQRNATSAPVRAPAVPRRTPSPSVPRGASLLSPVRREGVSCGRSRAVSHGVHARSCRARAASLLQVLVDGELAASSENITELVIDLPFLP